MVIRGDLNLDGRIDYDDVFSLYGIVHGGAPISGDLFIASDVITDNFIDQRDWQALINHWNGVQIVNEVV